MAFSSSMPEQSHMQQTEASFRESGCSKAKTQIDPVDSGSSKGDSRPPQFVTLHSFRVPPRSLLLYQITVGIASVSCESMLAPILALGFSDAGRRLGNSRKIRAFGRY